MHEQIRGHIEKQNEKYRTQANKHRKPMVFKERRFGLEVNEGREFKLGIGKVFIL